MDKGRVCNRGTWILVVVGISKKCRMKARGVGVTGRHPRIGTRTEAWELNCSVEPQFKRGTLIQEWDPNRSVGQDWSEASGRG